MHIIIHLISIFQRLHHILVVIVVLVVHPSCCPSSLRPPMGSSTESDGKTANFYAGRIDGDDVYKRDGRGSEVNFETREKRNL